MRVFHRHKGWSNGNLDCNTARDCEGATNQNVLLQRIRPCVAGTTAEYRCHRSQPRGKRDREMQHGRKNRSGASPD
jgi:hypothetical protein